MVFFLTKLVLLAFSANGTTIATKNFCVADIDNVRVVQIWIFNDIVFLTETDLIDVNNFYFAHICFLSDRGSVTATDNVCDANVTMLKLYI